MTNPIITIHNTETDELIQREMNDVELAAYNEKIAEANADQAQVDAKASARSALLEKLGISEDEAKLLLG